MGVLVHTCTVDADCDQALCTRTVLTIHIQIYNPIHIKTHHIVTQHTTDKMGCGGGVKDDKFSDLNNAAYTGNSPKVKEQQKIEQKGKKKNAAREVAKEAMTPAHRAAQGGNPTILRQILDGGGNPAAIDPETGEMPLHIACFHKHTEVVRLLLTYDEVLSAINTQDNKFGMTPLHIAIKKGDPKIVQMLLTAGADRLVVDKMGRTALFVAEQCDEQAASGLTPTGSDYPACFNILMEEVAA